MQWSKEKRRNHNLVDFESIQQKVPDPGFIVIMETSPCSQLINLTLLNFNIIAQFVLD
jgi:hypothetical protein